MVSLFTRPRRFGKSLNMDMLKTFFEKTNEDNSCYFKDKKIWACGEKYTQHQGKYPVIYVSFKDAKCDDWDTTLAFIKQLLQSEFSRHGYLKDSSKIDDFEKSYLKRILSGEAGEAEYMRAFAMLSQMLHKHHGVAPIIIIDEYDTPIQQGHTKNFYDKVVLFMRNLFSGGLKDNEHLSFGFLTGILRVAKESIFSGLNNITVYSVLDTKYSQYFGFTPNEVRAICSYYGVADKYTELCDWYDGYKFGTTEIFNPWSVINYFANNCIPKAFWQSTGSNDIIGEVLSSADADVYEQLQKLLRGESITSSIDTGVIYPQLRSNPASVYSFLLVSGYLKGEYTHTSNNGDDACILSIPNREIAYVYNKEILQTLDDIIPPNSATLLRECLYRNDVDGFKLELEKLLRNSASVFDTTHENFFHGLMLGLCAITDNKYIVFSNKESGYGRFDICLTPRTNSNPAFILELKYEKNLSEDQLNCLAEKALNQISEKCYDTHLKQTGIITIYKYGIAFSGKNVAIKHS